jgi:hypothetical protein
MPRLSPERGTEARSQGAGCHEARLTLELLTVEGSIVETGECVPDSRPSATAHRVRTENRPASSPPAL